MDSMVIIFFVLFSAFVGIVTYMKTRGGELDTSDGYFLGGRNLTSKVIAGSYFYQFKCCEFCRNVCISL